MVSGKVRNSVLAAVLIALGSCVLIGFFLPVSHVSFNKKAETIIKKKAGLDSCVTGKVKITLFRGITITDLVCIKYLDAKKRLTVAIPSVRIRYRFLKIVSRWKALNTALFPTQKHIRKKRIQWHSRTMVSMLYSHVFRADTLTFSCVKSLVVRNARVSIDSMDALMLQVKGVNGIIRVPGGSVQHLKIKLSAKELRKDAIRVSRPVVTMQFNGPRCVIKKVEGRVFDAKFKAKCELDCMQNRIINGLFEITDFDLAQWYAMLGDTLGSIAGKGTFVMMIDIGNSDFTGLKGRGQIKMTDVIMDEIPLITTVALLTELEGLSHLTFKEITGDFVVKDGKILSENINSHGDPLSMYIKGWIRPEDVNFEFDLKGVFEAYYKDSVSAIVWNAMLPDEDDRRLFKCTVYGTPDSPTVSLDEKIARRAVRGVFQSFGQELRGMFRKGE